MAISSETAALLALIALAALLRFATLGLQSIDFDEAFGIHEVLNGSLGHALSQIPKTESSPPLHYVIAWLWSRPFGLGDVALRTLSAAAGTALVPVTWLAARELVSRRGALIAAAFVAVNPFLIFYAQEARTYGLLALLSGLSFWAFARALSTPSNGRLASWAAISGVALTSHYFAAFVVVPEAVWLVVSGTRRGPALVASAAVGAVGAALLPLALSQADVRTEWITAQSLAARTRGVVSKFLVGEFDPTSDAVLLVVAVALVGLLAWAVRSAGGPRALGGAATAAAVGTAAVAVPLALDLAGLHFLIAKNVIGALPVLAVAAGGILGAPRAGRAARLTAGALCAAWLAIYAAAALDPRLQRPDYRSAADAVAPSLGPDVAVVTPYHGSEPLEVHLPGAQPAPPQGVPAREILLVQPLTRRDVHAPARAPTPAAVPRGFAFAGRTDARSYTLVRYRAPRPVAVGQATAQLLAPGKPTREPVVLQRPDR